MQHARSNGLTGALRWHRSVTIRTRLPTREVRERLLPLFAEGAGARLDPAPGTVSGAAGDPRLRREYYLPGGALVRVSLWCTIHDAGDERLVNAHCETVPTLSFMLYGLAGVLLPIVWVGALDASEAVRFAAIFIGASSPLHWLLAGIAMNKAARRLSGRVAAALPDEACAPRSPRSQTGAA